MIKKLNLILLFSLISTSSFANPAVDLKKGSLDGQSWSTESMKGRIAIVFYVDPDKKNLNNKASEALKEKEYDIKKVQSYAIINMKATWLPNIAISKSIKAKQKKYPRTKYVKDYKFYLSKGWDFKSKGNDVFVFDANGNELFRNLGKLDDAQIEKLIATIDSELNK